MKHKIIDLLKERVLVLDGAMGTQIQQAELSEEDFRGERFRDWTCALKGNNDLLSLVQPHLIYAIHQSYLEAGADIIATNTFNAQAISLLDYRMTHLVHEINYEAAQLARKAVEVYETITPNKPRFVSGSIGPTNRTTSMSPRVEDPMYRAVTFDEMRLAYKEQIIALIEGGVDLLLIETIFDTLNAKAALFAADEVREEMNKPIPVMISATITDKSGRTLSGQTLEAFLASVSHVDCLSIGLNCAFGAREMYPHLKELSRLAPCFISAHPNAGLPNQLGEYDETPQSMASQVKEFLDEGLVNIIGGCCGTNPQHIAALVKLARTAQPHIPVEKPKYMWLSGLELFEAKPEMNFINVGERCNVAGSRRFLRLINEKKYEEALTIAHKQVADGAQLLDVNMDDGLLDGPSEMTQFLNLVASDPEVARVPIMIDSSNWEVIEAGLKCTQGKSIVNSISLKEGESVFLAHARLIRKYGAAVIVMAFDEKGQADTLERRIEICNRAYQLLVNDGFNPLDIIFDPNVLAIATGIEEHRTYAIDFLDTITWIKTNLPGAKISGGISNLSFSFRGNEYIRQVMHSVFLYYAIQRGMDMAIVNPGLAVTYEDIPNELRILTEDVIFNRRAEATDELITYAEQHKSGTVEKTNTASDEWRLWSVDRRLSYALQKGISDYLEEDLKEALTYYSNPVDIIDQPLMNGMNRVGVLFGEGKMFLPQVVKTARTMKQAVSILQPALEKQKANQKLGLTKNAKLLIATVKGDVHDIGKNIVAIVLSCNSNEVIDLGVMTPTEVIIQKVKEIQPDMICLSGLITPSLEEMCNVARAMQKEGFSIPILIGGATTSKLHTALKIAPNYPNGIVVHTEDASKTPGVVAQLMNPLAVTPFIESLKEEYKELCDELSESKEDFLSFSEAKANRYPIAWTNHTIVSPHRLGRRVLNAIPIEEVTPYINWKFFFPAWGLSGRFASIQAHEMKEDAIWTQSFPKEDGEKAVEAAKLYRDAQHILHQLIHDKVDFIHAVYGIYEAYSQDEAIVVEGIEFPMLRQQKTNKDGYCLSLCDFVSPQQFGEVEQAIDYLGAFAVTAGVGADTWLINQGKESDDYYQLLLKSLLDRLVEATTEWLHRKIRVEEWGFSSNESSSIKELFALKYQGIRPAVGYPSIPDQSMNFLLHHKLLKSQEIGIELTENGVMYPNASESGFIFSHPEAKYFAVGKIGGDQLMEYAKKRELDEQTIKKFLASNL